MEIIQHLRPLEVYLDLNKSILGMIRKVQASSNINHSIQHHFAHTVDDWTLRLSHCYLAAFVGTHVNIIKMVK